MTVAEVRIHGLSSDGEGVGREESGRVVFVPATAPGDLVRVRIEQAKKRFARATLLEVVEPGPGRIAPRCPLVGTCGGCVWQHLDGETQRVAKAERVREAFGRVGGLDPPATIDCIPCDDGFGYRSRARIGFRDGVVGYRRAGSHQLCAASACPVLVPALEAALAELQRDPPRGNGELTLAAGDDGTVDITGDGRPGRTITIDAAGDSLDVSTGGFFQANASLRGTLARAVHEAAGEGQRLLELYCGSGFFTLGLARRFREVCVVESQGRATRDLARNLGRAGLDNVEVMTAQAERRLASPRLVEWSPEVVVLDPPRKGLLGDAAERIAAMAAERIVYVACDPATQARDVAALAIAGGYRLESLRAFDLFPQTPHVESLAVLVRGPAGRARAS